LRPRDEQRASRLLRQLARAAEGADGSEGIEPRSHAAVHPVLYLVVGVSRLGRDLVRIDRELDGLRGLGMGTCMGMGMRMGMGMGIVSSQAAKAAKVRNHTLCSAASMLCSTGE
jgi:hypothetical protein